ncbi:MAG: hypothetical protein ACR2QE_12555, partial [Acidimicrobiales bacterium]
RSAKQLHDPVRLTRAALASFRGWSSDVVGVDDEKVMMIEAALDAIGPTSSAPRSRLLTNLCVELGPGGDDDRILSTARMAVDTARGVGDPELLLDALGTIGAAYPPPCHLAERAAAAAEGLELVPRVSDPRLQFAAIARQFHVAVSTGDLAECDRMLAKADRIASRTRGRVRTAHAARFHLTLSLLRGDIDEAKRLTTEMPALAQAAAEPDPTHYARIASGAILGARDRFQVIVDFMDKEPDDRATHTPYELCTLAWAAAECGRYDRARVELTRIVRMVEKNAHSRTIAPGIPRAARAAALISDENGAAVLYDMMSRWDDLVVGLSPAHDGPTAGFLGLLATELEKYGDAERHFTNAEALCDRMGTRLFMAHNDVDHARMLSRRRARGDHDHARTLLDRALAIAAAHGYQAVQRHGDDILTRLDRA